MNYTSEPKRKFSLYHWLMAKRIKLRETDGKPYMVTTFLDDYMVSSVGIDDPFIHTRLKVGWYHLLLALLFRRRLDILVIVNADPATINYVLEANPDYLSPARRVLFNASMEDALGAFGETE